MGGGDLTCKSVEMVCIGLGNGEVLIAVLLVLSGKITVFECCGKINRSLGNRIS